MSQEPPDQPTDEAAEQPVVRRTPRPGGNRERTPEPPPSRPAAATPRPGGSRERSPEPPPATPDEETPAPRPQRVRRPAAAQPSPEATTPLMPRQRRPPTDPASDEEPGPLAPRQRRPPPASEEPESVPTVPLGPRPRRQRPVEPAAEAPAEEAPVATPPRRPQRPAAERPAAQPMRQRPPAQRPPARPAAPARAARATGSSDIMPLVLSGVVGALLLALLAVFALSNNPLGSPSTSNILRIATPTLLVIEVGQPTATPGTSSEADPPRIALDEFKQLYDDPAQRPLIVDVRATENYSEGHIAGAISVPEAEVPGLLNLLPKEKMIVLYCQ